MFFSPCSTTFLDVASTSLRTWIQCVSLGAQREKPGCKHPLFKTSDTLCRPIGCQTLCFFETLREISHLILQLLNTIGILFQLLNRDALDYTSTYKGTTQRRW